jgi:putative peptidoglycan lipid II flippase
LQTKGEEASRRLVGSLLTLLALVLTAAVVGIEIVLVIWRAIDDDAALRLTAILMPYMALICTAAVASGVLNVRRHFAVPAAAPTILNVAMIVALLGGAIVCNRSGTAHRAVAHGTGETAVAHTCDDATLMDWVCFSVLVAGVVQLLITGVTLKRVGFFPRFSAAWRDPQLRRVFALMGPMALGLSAVQINTLVDSIIAYLFVTENGERVGPAVLGYAQFLYQLPLGVAGISLATAIFPDLSTKAAEGDRAGLAEVFSRGVRMSLFIALPSAVGLILVAEPLVATLYQRGEFDASDTSRVAATLVFYSLGVPAYFVQHIVVRAFYALQDSRTPARAAIAMVVLDLAMNLVLVFVMEERGLALATAVCATLQVGYLLFKLKRLLPPSGSWTLVGSLSRTLMATAAMAFCLALIHWWGIGGSSAPFRLVVLVFVGVGVYISVAYALKVEELRNWPPRD